MEELRDKEREVRETSAKFKKLIEEYQVTFM